MAIATLTVDLVAKLFNIEADLGKVGHIAQKQADQMNAAFGSVRSTLAGLGVGITLGGAITAFVTATKALDNLNDAADATGASIDTLSKLEEVARRNGAGIELVETAVLKMDKAFAGADEEGKGAAAVIKAIGLNVAELKQMDPAAALQKVAIAFNGFETDGNKARNAQILFGKSIAEVAPFLKDLAEAGELQATATAQQTEEAERFNKSLYGLQTNIGNAARSIAADLLPNLNLLIGAYSDTRSESGGLSVASEIVQTTFEAISVAGVNVAYVFKQIGNEIGGMAAQTAALATLDFDRFSAIGNMMKSDAAAARKEVDALTASLLARNKAMNDVMGPPIDLKAKPRMAAVGGSSGSASKDAKDQYAYIDAARKLAQDVEKELAALQKREEELAAPIGNILQKLREQAQGLRETAETAGMSQGEIAALTASQIEDAAVLAELNGAYPSQAEALRAVAAGYRDVAKASDEMRIKTALQDTVTGKLEAQRKEMQFFADALDRGTISAEQFSEIATSKLGLVADEAKNTKGIAEELGLTFASAFEDAIVSGAKFSDVLKGIEKDLIRIVARKAITEPLGNAISGVINGALGTGGGNGGSVDMLSAASSLYKLFGGSGASGPELLNSVGPNAVGAGSVGTSGILGTISGGLSAYNFGQKYGTVGGIVGSAGTIAAGGAISGALAGTGAISGASAALAAIPVYGWIAIAVMAILGGMSKGGGPKNEGTYDSKNIERFFTDTKGDPKAKDFVTALQGSYIDLAKTLGGKANTDLRMAFGFALDPIGDAPNALHLAVGNQQFIQDKGRPEDFQAQATDALNRGLLSALKQTDLYDSIDGLLAAFDPMTATSEEVAAEFTKITDAMNALTAQAQDYGKSLLAIGDQMQSTHNMFNDSVRNIRYGTADSTGKYAILDNEASRYRDMLKVLSDPTLIQDYSKRLNDTINSAFALLSPDQQAAQADSFIQRLEAADTLAQARLQTAADAQKAVYASLPADLKKSVEEAFATLPAQIAAAIPKELSIDFKANVAGSTEVALIG